MQNRLQLLYQFLEEDPKDPFNIYALATELLKTNEQEAWKFYNQLLTEHENYVATYYHAAKLQEIFRNKTAAEEIYQKGMVIAKTVGDSKAFTELQRAYNNFLYEDDE